MLFRSWCLFFAVYASILFMPCGLRSIKFSFAISYSMDNIQKSPPYGQTDLHQTYSGWHIYSGAHGLKSDVRDITNHIENLSLSELLDGTYKYSSLGREKGKKVLRTKEELLVSVRKAFSMLSDMDYCHGKDSNIILSPKLPPASTSSCDIKEQCGDKPSPLVKVSKIFSVTTNIMSASKFVWPF